MQYDWSTFTKRIPIKADIIDVYRAWATEAGLESWFLRLSEFITEQGDPRDAYDYVQPGDLYKWLWHGWGDEVIHYGKVIKTNGADQISFTFDAGDKTTDMQVSVQMSCSLDFTIVELTQIHIPVDEQSKFLYHIGCMEGWTFYLTNLKSILEGGIDLRNKEVEIKKVINS